MCFIGIQYYIQLIGKGASPAPPSGITLGVANGLLPEIRFDATLGYPGEDPTPSQILHDVEQELVVLVPPLRDDRDMRRSLRAQIDVRRREIDDEWAERGMEATVLPPSGWIPRNAVKEPVRHPTCATLADYLRKGAIREIPTPSVGSPLEP